MQNTTILTRVNHRDALEHFAGARAKTLSPVSMSEIEEYVNNLWTMDEDPFLYTTD